MTLVKRALDVSLLEEDVSRFRVGNPIDQKLTFGFASLDVLFKNILGEVLDQISNDVYEETVELIKITQTGSCFDAEVDWDFDHVELAQRIVQICREKLQIKDISNVVDIMYRIAVHADIKDGAIQGNNPDYYDQLRSGTWEKRDILSVSKIEEPFEVLGTFCQSLSIFRIADELRLSIFRSAPLSAEFFASGHATRQMIRIGLKLEVMARKLFFNDVEGIEKTSAFARYSRRNTDALARHLFRYPRERASMLIIEATMLRLLSTDNNQKESLGTARSFLTRAEAIVLGMGWNARIKLCLALERSKLNRALARMHIADGNYSVAREFTKLSGLDISYIGERARNKGDGWLWKTIAGMQEARIMALEQKLPPE